MVSNRVPRKWTAEEYLADEEEIGIKHEYINSEMVAMSGGAKNHSFITGNTFIGIGIDLPIRDVYRDITFASESVLCPNSHRT